MAYRQILSATDNEATINDLRGGAYLLLLKSNGGTWALAVLTPDEDEIEVATFASDTQQRFEIADDTPIKLSGGTVGAKAWVNRITRDVGDFI